MKAEGGRLFWNDDGAVGGDREEVQVNGVSQRVDITSGSKDGWTHVNLKMWVVSWARKARIDIKYR